MSRIRTDETRAYEREWRRKKYATDEEYKKRKRATDKAWADRIRAELRAYKLEHGCADCGYNKCSAALHFHHLDESGKELTLANAIRYSRVRVWDEVAKCEILCANCHAEIHGECG